MLHGLLISLTGFLVVFIILFLLYLAVNLLRVLSSKREITIDASDSTDDSDDLAAIMGAISLVLEGKNYNVNKIYLNKDTRTMWSKERWQNLYR